MVTLVSKISFSSCYDMPTSRGGISWILVWLLRHVPGMVAARVMDITDSYALPADLSSIHSLLSWERQPISFYANSGSLLGEAVGGPEGARGDPGDQIKVAFCCTSPKGCQWVVQSSVRCLLSELSFPERGIQGNLLRSAGHESSLVV